MFPHNDSSKMHRKPRNTSRLDNPGQHTSTPRNSDLRAVIQQLVNFLSTPSALAKNPQAISDNCAPLGISMAIGRPMPASEILHRIQPFPPRTLASRLFGISLPNRHGELALSRLARHPRNPCGERLRGEGRRNAGISACRCACPGES